MQATNCPVCFTKLEVRDVAPCMDCGWDPTELEHLEKGEHTYAEYRLFGDLTLVLCDFCRVDFMSYDPTYFGLPPKARLPYPELLRQIEKPAPGKDKWCPEGHGRLSFIEFLMAARELNGKRTQ